MRVFRHFVFALLIGLVSTSSVKATEVVVTAGANPTDIHAIHVTVNQEDVWKALADGAWKLVNGDEEIPLQVIRRDMPSYHIKMEDAKTVVAESANAVWELLFIVKGLKPYEQRVYQIENSSESAHISLDRDDNKITIHANGKPYTEYRYAVTKEMPRPVLYPVFGPKGAQMTRSYPLEDAKEHEKKDHPHHHSLWVSHGDVNKVDFWILGEKQGYQRHDSFSAIESGAVAGRIEGSINWEDSSGNHVMKEKRTLTFWAPADDLRFIDFDLTFIADTGDVVFGDTKEGGLVSLRVAGTMKEEAKMGGVITNANGLVGMKEAWGKAAPWCDYSGPVDGNTVGLTIMDHPDNPFYPTYYHVRDYGLFTANPFGLSHFTNNKSNDGSRILKHGTTWRCQYRIYIHPGDVKSGNAAGQYDAYVNMPRVVLR